MIAASVLAVPVLRGHTQVPDFAAIRAKTPVAFGFFDVRHGVISTGDGLLLATADGGRSWRRVGRLWLRGIDVASSYSAYATRGHSLLRTDDRGVAWNLVARVSGTLSFADPQHGWIVDGSRALATDDGAATLNRLRTPCALGIDQTLALSRVTATLGFAACGGEPGAGEQLKRLFVTYDAGRT
jgi:photosystem II stability/assembly factor-like uncharacterized protein